MRGEGSLAEKAVGLGYLQVCGDAAVWGDGIVPLPTAHLPGAEHLDLDGVYHSPLGASAVRFAPLTVHMCRASKTRYPRVLAGLSQLLKNKKWRQKLAWQTVSCVAICVSYIQDIASGYVAAEQPHGLPECMSSVGYNKDAAVA